MLLEIVENGLPAAALIRHEGQTYVFVQGAGGDKGRVEATKVLAPAG